MNVTGFQLREAIKNWTLRRETAVQQFNTSKIRHKDSTVPPLKQLMQTIEVAERAVAGLQTAQSAYNMKVEVKLFGKKMTLAEAVRLVGGAGRIENMWRDCASVPESYGGGARDKDTTYPEAAIAPAEAVELATKAAKMSNALRGAIAEGNGKSMDIELEGSLLE